MKKDYIYVKIPASFEKYGLILGHKDWYIVLREQGSLDFKWRQTRDSELLNTKWLDGEVLPRKVKAWVRIGHRPIFKLL